jgi:hypothetical protein
MFTRVFTSILDSSINMQSVPPSARWLWITMLLIADDERTGVVDMPVERLAARAGLSIEQTHEALSILSAPDADSSSGESEGRRLVPIRDDSSRGWRLVNYEKYQQIAVAEHKREQTRLRVANHRDRGRDEKSETPQTALESTNEAPAIPTHIQPTDLAMVAGLSSKLAMSGLQVPPGEPLIIAWLGRFGAELIIETIDDCLGSLSGKHFNYLQQILRDREADPSRRPINRMKASQPVAGKGGNGSAIGPDGVLIPPREGDYWGGN